jgi:hypothetical protein
MNKNLFSILCLTLLFTVNIFAQKQLNTGKVVMEITGVASDNDQTAMALEMMKGSQTEINFTSEKYGTKTSMMGGMIEVKSYINQGAKSFDMLMDMMGQKMWIFSNLDEMTNNPEAKKAAEAKIEYNKEDKKVIKGYNCYGVKVAMPEDAGGMSMTGYVTEDIKTGANIIQGMQSLKFNGLPLEFTIKNPAMSITMTAVEITDSPNVDALTAKTDGYTKMTMDEFKQKMSAMGAGGFGF